jgi:hypothetical protein
MKPKTRRRLPLVLILIFSLIALGLRVYSARDTESPLMAHYVSLPARGRIGYITNRTGDDHTLHYLTAMAALAPAILIDSPSCCEHYLVDNEGQSAWLK